MMRKIVLICLFVILGVSGISTSTAAAHPEDRQDIHSRDFRPEWFVQVLGGAAYSLGEADFVRLLSPAAQASAGCHFSRLFGARVAFSGWQARNLYNYPRFDYSWNYVRSSAEIVLDVTSALAGWREGRLVSLNLFAGGGAAVGFRNLDANRARRNNPDFHGLENYGQGLSFSGRGGEALSLTCVLPAVCPFAWRRTLEYSRMTSIQRLVRMTASTGSLIVLSD